VATTDLIGAPERTRTTPLPNDIVRAVAVYETASLHAAELAAQSASGKDLPAVDVRSWEFAEELMAGARATLAAAGMLHLIEAAR
jgi:hypothetical protein